MRKMVLIGLLLVAFTMFGCNTPLDVEDVTPPTISSTSPADVATAVERDASVTATFDEDMDSTTITDLTFTLAQGATPIAGAVSYAEKVATFNPTADLVASTEYTATVTVSVKDVAGNALAAAKVWTFTTTANPPAGPAMVDLGVAGDYVILAKTGITNTGVTVITGDIAVSPIDSTAMTGFALVLDDSGTFSTSTFVVGSVFASNYIEPTPTNLTAAILAMQAAYEDAESRLDPNELEFGGGEIGGQILVPGLYKWTTAVSITTDVTLDGAADDVWIFQITGAVAQAATARVLLTGGAVPANVFWQVGGAVAVGANAHMEGNVLAAGAISFAAGASVNGSLMSQTAVTLDATTVN